MKINGTSIINHSIRIKLNLTLHEYILLDFIFSSKNGNLTFNDYYTNLGFNKTETQNIINSLKEKKFLVWNNKIDVCHQWKNEFNVDDKVDELWLIHPSGTKAKVKQRLPNVLKQINYIDLKDKLIKYVESCNINESFPKNLDTFLNPKDKNWESVVINKSKSKFISILEKPKQINFK